MKRDLFMITALFMLSLSLSGNSHPDIIAPIALCVTPPVAPATPCVAPPEGGQGGSLKRQKETLYKDAEQKQESIKIGLLIQSKTSCEAKNGAEMAVAEANMAGGFRGKNFELVVRSMEGPWGTGSKQAVELIFTDEVIAIVGSHDSRNAHLVEQATTKSHVAFLSAWAADPTLSQAFTPWFFSAVADNDMQAEMLKERIFKSEKFNRIAVVTDEDYEASSAFKSFIRVTSGKESSMLLTIRTGDLVISEITGRIANLQPDCLLLFTGPGMAERIILNLAEMKSIIPVYGPLSLLGEASPLYMYPGVMENLLYLSSGDWFMREKSEFAAGYHKKFGTFPGAAASYSYDAMMVMINAIIASGADRSRVHKTLLTTDYNGVTGRIKFDDKGRRVFPLTGVNR